MNGLMMIPHVVPAIAAVDMTTAETKTGHINAGLNQWVTLLVQFGSADAASLDIAVYQTSANTTVSATGVDCRYRLTAAVGTDLIGAVTSATLSATATLETTGAGVASMALVIDVDPADMTDGKKYLHATITGSTGNNLAGATWLLYPRYAQAVPVSST